MELTDSPFHACQAVKWDKSIVLGNRQNIKESFCMVKSGS